MSARQMCNPEQGTKSKIFAIVLAAFVVCCAWRYRQALSQRRISPAAA